MKYQLKNMISLIKYHFKKIYFIKYTMLWLQNLFFYEDLQQKASNKIL